MEKIKVERINSNGCRWKDMTKRLQVGNCPEYTHIWAHRTYGRYPRVEIKILTKWNNLMRRAELVHTPTGVKKVVKFWYSN